MTTVTRTPGGARAYALLDKAFADPSRAREIAVEISGLDAGGPEEAQEIADAARICVKLIPDPEPAGLAAELAHFDPGQPRGPDGKWASAGLPWDAAGGSTVHYHGSLGISRADMPQLSGTVRGTYQGSAEVGPKFTEHLRSQGISVTGESVPASSLKPTQADGDMRVIRGIAGSLERGGAVKPVFVSSDGRVLDGHHTWAARVLAGRERPELGMIRVLRAGVPIRALLAEAARFGAAEGIARRASGEIANPAYRHRTGLAAELAAAHGHHIPGTPYEWRHGWIPVAPGERGARDSLSDHTRGGKLDPQRQALHDKIVAGHLAGHQREAHPVAVFLGGGTAAGKSTRWPRGSQPGVQVDSDEIKGELPEYGPLAAARDRRAASHMHEESSMLSKRIVAGAERAGYSYTLDGTGDGTYDKMKAKIDSARRAGHLVVGKYMTLDTGEAIRRAEARAQQTGRAVSPRVARELHAAVSDVFARLVANDDFDAAELWDNNGEQPALVGRKELGGTWQVTDPVAWQRFLAKREEE